MNNHSQTIKKEVDNYSSNVSKADSRAAAKTPSSEDFGEQLSVIREDVAKLVETIAGISKERGEGVAGAVADEARKIGEKGAEALDVARDESVKLFEAATDLARKQPGTALSIAVGVGLISGLLLRR